MGAFCKEVFWKMNTDMKDLQQMAEDKGYKLVKFDEYQTKIDQELKTRFLFVFEGE